MKAIVVDDSSVVRKIVGSFLGLNGFDVVLEAKNGIEALQLLAVEPAPALAIVDVNMPRMNGIQLVGLLRANPRFEGMKIIILTAEPDRRVLAGLARVNGYIPKPFTEARMHKALAALGFALSAPAADVRAG